MFKFFLLIIGLDWRIIFPEGNVIPAFLLAAVTCVMTLAAVVSCDMKPFLDITFAYSKCETRTCLSCVFVT